jgi:LacI family fructose operon transcriptional repressor
VAQRHRDVAERVLEIVLASLDEPRKPKPGLTVSNVISIVAEF